LLAARFKFPENFYGNGLNQLHMVATDVDVVL